MIIDHVLEAKLTLSGSFDCLDKDGNVLKTIVINGTIPIEIEQKEDNGTNHSE